MVRKKFPWSTETAYRSPHIKEIKEFFGKNIYEVPGGSTFANVADAIERYSPRKTIDLRHVFVLPRSQKEKRSYDLGLLVSDTENIIFANEKELRQYGALWKITDEEFNESHSNLLKYAWPTTLKYKKKFMERVKASQARKEIQFEPRFRYEAVEQDVKDGIYNAWDYIILIKGGIGFYNNHCRGKHFDIDPSNNCWIVQVPSDEGLKEGSDQKIYDTIIEYIPKKERAMRYYTGSCTCPDYKARKRDNVNPICKHQVSAVAELASHGVELDEIMPFPTSKAFKLHEKVDCMLYPEGSRTDTSKDAIIGAYIIKKTNLKQEDLQYAYINSLFTTNPEYVVDLHRSYRKYII